MSSRAVQRAAPVLAAVILVLIVAGVVAASDQREGPDGARARPAPVTTVTPETPSTVADTSPPVTTTSAPQPRVTTPPVTTAPATTPVTLSYDPMQVPPASTAPPTTVGVGGGGGLGCHESLVPIPECGMGPYVTEPPP